MAVQPLGCGISGVLTAQSLAKPSKIQTGGLWCFLTLLTYLGRDDTVGSSRRKGYERAW